MDFLILRPLPPKTGYHFWGGGWGGLGVGVGGGGSKVFAQQASSSGEAECCSIAAGPMVTQPTVVGGSNPGLLTFAAAAPLQIISAPGLEPPS